MLDFGWTLFLVSVGVNGRRDIIGTLTSGHHSAHQNKTKTLRTCKVYGTR
uniref:Uncharacterized protein n=1 Tax=Anguilla anguilla TaxID=7936 RepID=A0A0E9V8G5_ANGAN